MKYRFVLLLFPTLSLISQEDSRINYYVASGLSISNNFDTTLSYSTFPSLEFGGMYENVGLSLVVGRNNLSGFQTDFIRNYWYEIKSFASHQIGGHTSGYLLFGLGNYVDDNRFFIEYGVGISYVPNKFGWFAQASNWEGTWYISPGLVYNF